MKQISSNLLSEKEIVEIYLLTFPTPCFVYGYIIEIFLGPCSIYVNYDLKIIEISPHFSVPPLPLILNLAMGDITVVAYSPVKAMLG